MPDIFSMTAYGGADGMAEGQALTVEMRGVNNRYLDIAVRLPKNYLFAEDAVKKIISAKVNRGKIDVYVSSAVGENSAAKVSANCTLAREYYDAVSAIAENLGLENGLDAFSVARFPDVLSVTGETANPGAVTAALQAITAEAVKEFNEMRKREGERLRVDIEDKVDTLEKLLDEIERRSPETVSEYRYRLETKLREVLEDRQIDESRLITEAALFADKVSVDEETVRLRSHISQLRHMLSAGSPVGRKLDFLVQEFNREANTIGSKCSDASLANVVVEMKSEIEKIREQIQNIE